MTGVLARMSAPSRSAQVAGSIADELAAVDWNFPASRSEPLHSIHPYPAKFIPEIPRALLGILPPPRGTSVLDPFVGSGTTIVEAQQAGFDSIGVDLNPIAILISKVKTQGCPIGTGEALSVVVERALNDADDNVPEIPRLDHWFRVDIQRALARLSRSIAQAEPQFSDILRLSLSSIIVRVSNQDSDTRYAAVDKNVTYDDVFRFFVKSAQAIMQNLPRAEGNTSARPETMLLQSDILEVTAKDIGRPVGLVVTSPPYPNAYEYWLYHKYRMWWLGFDPLSVKDSEIGARAHFFGGKRHTAQDFVRQMECLSGTLSDVVVPGGHVCVVVGRSRIHGVDIDNGNLIGTALGNNGFEPVFNGTRAIRPTSKSFNLSHANIKSESLIVFRRSS